MGSKDSLLLLFLCNFHENQYTRLNFDTYQIFHLNFNIKFTDNWWRQFFSFNNTMFTIFVAVKFYAKIQQSKNKLCKSNLHSISSYIPSGHKFDYPSVLKYVNWIFTLPQSVPSMTEAKINKRTSCTKKAM